MSEDSRPGRTGLSGAAESLIHGWALFGGSVLFLIVLVNVISVVGGIFGRPFPGDFELTQIGVVIAAFSFLPYCQLTNSNVTADIFTAKASRRWIAIFATTASLVAAAFGSILLWRMYAGMLDQREYEYQTAILQIPVWWAFVPILVSLALLVCASVLTFLEGCRDSIRGGGV